MCVFLTAISHWRVVGVVCRRWCVFPLSGVRDVQGVGPCCLCVCVCVCVCVCSMEKGESWRGERGGGGLALTEGPG